MGRQKQSKSEKWKHPVLTSLALGYGLSKENSAVKRSRFKHLPISKIKSHGCSLVPMQIDGWEQPRSLMGLIE